MILLQTFAQLRPMLPALITAMSLTMLALVILMLAARGAWVTERRFHITGLFFGLGGMGSLKLACCWLKLIFVIFFVIAFRQLDLLQLMMVIIPGATGAVAGKSLLKGAGDFIWLFLQLAGLISANLVCGFIREMAGGAPFVMLYIAMGAFLILFSIYLFLNEMNAISASRDIKPEQIWREEQYEIEN